MADDRCRRGPGRGKSEHHQAACRVECAGAAGESRARRKVSQKTYRPSPQGVRVRVKRRGKSPPPGAQAPGHEKPHAVQDKTGSRAAWPVRASGQLPGNSRILPQRAGVSRERRERNDHRIRGQPRRNRIRLTASRKRGRSPKGERPACFRSQRPPFYAGRCVLVGRREPSRSRFRTLRIRARP